MSLCYRMMTCCMYLLFPCILFDSLQIRIISASCYTNQLSVFCVLEHFLGQVKYVVYEWINILIFFYECELTYFVPPVFCFTMIKSFWTSSTDHLLVLYFDKRSEIQYQVLFSYNFFKYWYFPLQNFIHGINYITNLSLHKDTNKILITAYY